MVDRQEDVRMHNSDFYREDDFISTHLEHSLSNLFIPHVLNAIQQIPQPHDCSFVLSEDIAGHYYYNEFKKNITNRDMHLPNLRNYQYVVPSIQLQVESNTPINKNQYAETYAGQLRLLLENTNLSTTLLNHLSQNINVILNPIRNRFDSFITQQFSEAALLPTNGIPIHMINQHDEKYYDDGKTNWFSRFQNPTRNFIIRSFLDKTLCGVNIRKISEIQICIVVQIHSYKFHVPICRINVDHNASSGYNIINGTQNVVGIYPKTFIKDNNLRIYALHVVIRDKINLLLNTRIAPWDSPYAETEIKNIIFLALMSDLYTSNLAQIKESIRHVNILCDFLNNIFANNLYQHCRAVLVVGYLISAYLRRRKSSLAEITNMIVYTILRFMYERNYLEKDIEKFNVSTAIKFMINIKDICTKNSIIVKPKKNLTNVFFDIRKLSEWISSNLKV